MTDRDWGFTRDTQGALARAVRFTRAPAAVASGIAVAFAGWSGPAQASFLHGEALDTVANVVSWLVLILVPVVGIVGFLLIHILPEKIAEKRKHPQLSAIKTLCLLSLVFGGMLWPLAWLWAYTKPVLHKMAYGTDVDNTPHHGEALTPVADAREEEGAAGDTADVSILRERIATLEARLAAQQRGPDGGGA